MTTDPDPRRPHLIETRLGWSLLEWAGIDIGEGRSHALIERFAEAMRWSSIPEACSEIGEALREADQAKPVTEYVVWQMPNTAETKAMGEQLALSRHDDFREAEKAARAARRRFHEINGPNAYGYDFIVVERTR